jgi:hypothetical protein
MTTKTDVAGDAGEQFPNIRSRHVVPATPVTGVLRGKDASFNSSTLVDEGVAPGLKDQSQKQKL